MSKKVTRRFMQAVFTRGKSEYLPLDYIQQQAAKVIDPDEMNRIKPVLDEMAAEGLVEVTEEGYKLLKEVG